MQHIKLTISKRYLVGNRVYLAGQTYAVSDDLADILLNRVNERDVPYFRVVTDPDVVTEAKAVSPHLEKKKAAEEAAKPAPKKRATRKKAAKPKPAAEEEPSVDI